ncbi:V-type ATP synthase subunit I [Clostridium tetani]|uniref:ATPase n=1 Tax=Clostridium tetani TaxID=1513 RepID=A0A4V1LEQ3_CLOTA|nr:V-type ATPase 116kDa subunit family protein [Clostridium tetani]AVP53899.1 ATPase [Clostridium tetani]RXI48945.1 ATPase [Clostridium tetani]RXI73577.1 ATPase [Clostridium tetani]BDR76497.1 V-type ATP synthase subunit I [Clostridium tetani]
MSIEKMVMVNIASPIELIDSVTKEVVLSKTLHPVNAFDKISSGNFNISTTEENLDTLIDVNYVKPYFEKRDYSKVNEKINSLKGMLGERKNIEVKNENLILNYNELEENIFNIVDRIKKLNEDLNKYKNKKKELEIYKENLKYFLSIDTNIEKFTSLKNFELEAYKIEDKKFNIMKENYENIPAIVDKVYKGNGFDIIIVVSTKALKIDTERILNSLNCERLDLPLDYKGNPKEVINLIEKELIETEEKIQAVKNRINEFYDNSNLSIEAILKSFELEKRASKLREYIAYSKNFFYLSGWVPSSMIGGFKNNIKKLNKKIIVLEKKIDEIENGVSPPTKLRNNILVKPFEIMVNMYGTPSYGEIDPTTFLAITYMIMFGTMFGDVGQGLVLLLAGLYMKKKKENYAPGNILVRLGSISMIFGFLYGSVFGFEDLIKPILISPMENIQTMLVGSIAFGCFILIIGFLYGIVNNIKNENLEEGIFGRNGITGMVFYILLLVFAFTKITSRDTMSTTIWILIFVALLALMVLKQPLANAISKKGFVITEKTSDYFVESGFGVIETLLSMFSNTVSFIRVGAFALNHVGLFIAFASMAQMMKNNAGSILMYVLGNVIIIVLEGLIVFIQGLRLEYYELFSKYYDGSGLQFKPITIDSVE